MLVQTYLPEKLKPSDYNLFLSKGWFRGSSLLYRMELVCMEQTVHSVINVRLPLREFNFRDSHLKLLRKNGRRFRVVKGPAVVTPELEALYAKQKSRFNGFIHASLEDIFCRAFDHRIFSTLQFIVYDGPQAIAASFFDITSHSVASLLAICDPDYASSSLGIYTMLLEVNLAAEMNMDYYYPGYVLDGSPRFNYKMSLGHYEWMDERKAWRRYADAAPTDTLGTRFRSMMAALETSLRERGFDPQRRIYPHFVIPFLDAPFDDLLKFPAFLVIRELEHGHMLIGACDAETSTHYILEVAPAHHLNVPANLELSHDYRSGVLYHLGVLRVVLVIDEFR